jgi:hypothetical protein
MIAVLADASVRALVIALVVRALLAGLGVRSATLRHGVWTAVTVAMLLMPFRPDWLPALRVPARVQPLVDVTLKTTRAATPLPPPFLERSADLRPLSRERLLKSAEAIRKGVMPASYQAAFARR